MGSRRLSTYALGATLAIGSVWLLSHTFTSFARGRGDLDFQHDYSDPYLSASGDILPDPFERLSGADKGLPTNYNNSGNGHGKGSASSPPPIPLRRRNVTFATSFMYHGDVYMALAKSVGDVMDASGAGAQIHVFAQDFPYGFQEVVDELQLWKHQGVRAHYDGFVEFLNAEGAGGVDLVVLGTCQYDLPYWTDALKDAWNRRDPEDRFKIVCYVHNTKDMDWQRWIPYWSQRNAIRLVTLGDHVAKEFKRLFAVAADSRETTLASADFEHVPVDVHIPVLDVPDLPDKEPPRQLSRAVIQGKFEPDRRDYNRIFEQLIQSLNDDPAAWGYHPLDGKSSYEPNPASAVEPFQLLLVGSQYLGIPEELANVVVIHRDLPYKEFYTLISNSDIVLPAFADNSYYEIRASSTVALATELNIPMLVTNRTRHTYGFIDDERVVVTRPAAMSEVQALKALRTGDTTSFLAMKADPNEEGSLTMGEMPAVRAAVEKMMDEGWVRSKAGWTEWKQALWTRNRQVAEKILRDIP